MLSTFPAADTDTNNATIASMGTFWETVFPQPQQLQNTIDAQLLAYQQVQQQLQETADTVARKTTQPLATACLLPITFLQSSQQTIEQPYELDEGQTLDNGWTLDSGAFTTHFVYLLQADAPTVISVITNSLSTPTRFLFAGTDFIVEGNQIVFQVNPFLDTAYVTQPLCDGNGNQTDTSITLWCFRPQNDLQTLTNQFGYVLGATIPSSFAGRDFMNAVFDTLVDGPTPDSVGRALSAMLGAPLAIGNETVVTNVLDRHGIFVATDKHIYRFSGDAALVVPAGTYLLPGQALTDAFSLAPLTANAAVEYLTVQPDMINACNIQPIAFPNSDEELFVTTIDGYTYVLFPLIGNPDDITAFFSAAQAAGLARLGIPDVCGVPQTRGTIAQWLDTRVNPVGEPTAANLPFTVNPFKFLCDNCLQGGAWLAKIRLASCNDLGIGLQYAATLNKFLPKDISIFYAVETSAQDAEVQHWLKNVTILPAT